MKKYKNYNDFEPKYKLNKGERKTFRILNIKKNKSTTSGITVPTLTTVPTKDVVLVKGEPKDIACIKSIGHSGSITYHKLWFTKESAGTISLSGDSIADREIYEYLMMSNYRKGNPDRDPTYREIFELIDIKEGAKLRRATRTEKLSAANYANDMSNEDVLTFAKASGWDDTDIDILRDRIEDLAESDPVMFLKRAKNRQNNIKADIKRAIEMGIILWDKSAYKFSWASNNELITQVPRSTKGDYLDGILQFVLNTEHGNSVYEEIRNLVNDGQVQDVSTISTMESLDAPVVKTTTGRKTNVSKK